VETKKHHHGHLFRAKVVPFTGPAEYGEWFPTESALRSAMQQVARHIGKRYYCETMLITCAECENAGSESDTKPKVIASL
jgi:hypothetical protein